MKKIPTIKDTTGEAPETRADSVPPRNLALPECERLASSTVDWSDYPEHTDARGRVHEILDVIEEALASKHPERVEHIAGFADAIQGLHSPADCVRFELSRVRRAALRVEGAKHPERVANRLMLDLHLTDPRYWALGTASVLEHIRSCKVVDWSPKPTRLDPLAVRGPGRGGKGVEATLAALMAEAGAHDVTNLDAAKKKIASARTRKKTKPVVRPSEFRRLREE